MTVWHPYLRDELLIDDAPAGVAVFMVPSLVPRSSELGGDVRVKFVPEITCRDGRATSTYQDDVEPFLGGVLKRRRGHTHV